MTEYTQWTHCLALLLVTVVSQAKSAELTIFAEDGIHVSTRMEFDDDKSVKWIGFRSKVSSPVGPGELHTDDRTDRIREYVHFSKVNDAKLRQSLEKISAKFRSRQYRVNNSNCVVFSNRILRELGLGLSEKEVVAKLPRDYISELAEKYAGEVVHNVRPFPWDTSHEPRGELMRVRLTEIKCIKPESILSDDKVYLRVYADNKLVSEPKWRKSIGRGDRVKLNHELGLFAKNSVIVIQLWDDDTADPDDLILDRPLSVKVGSKRLRHKRGVKLLGSESEYEIEVTTSALPKK